MSALLDLGPGRPVDPELLAEVGPRPLLPRRRPRPQTRFDPAALAPTVWLRPETLQALGLSDGAAIDSWSNSGSAGGAFTATLTQRPLYKTGQINGWPGADFDGVDDQLQWNLTLASAVSASAFHWAVVYRADIISTNSATITSNDTVWSGANNCGLHLTSVPRARPWVQDGTGVSLTLTIAAGTFYRTWARLDGGTLFGDAASGATTSSDSAACGNVNPPSGSVRLGVSNTGGTRLDGQIIELLIFNTTLTAAERAGLQGYLSSRYEI